jgi:PAS domain S-box-containing protein
MVGTPVASPSDPRSAWTQTAEQLHLVLQEAADGITVQDPTGQVQYANRAAAQAMGFASPEELARTPQPDLLGRFEIFDEEGKPLVPDDLPGRRALHGDGSGESVVRFRVRATGEERWSLVRPRVVRHPDGSPAFIVSAFHDITALKSTERRLSLLADAGAILGSTADYQETLNELAKLVVRELADWCVVDVVEPESGIRRVAVAHMDPEKLELAEEVQRRYPSKPNPDAGVGMVLRTGEPLFVPVVSDEQLDTAAEDAEHAAYLRTLGLRSVVMQPLTVLTNVLGVLTLVRSDPARAFTEDDLPLIRDLANRAAVVVDNARLLHETTEALRSRDDFIAVASHDMRTPLAAILGYIQLAVRRLTGPAAVADAKLVEYLTAAEGMTDRLTALVSDLMDVSLIRGGQLLSMESEPIDLGRLAVRAVENYRQLAESHTFAVDAGDAPVTVHGDARRLDRVMDNLLSNAVKFSPHGGEIRVTLTTAGGQARLAITDRGMGIPEAEVAGVFERFRRGSNVGGVRGIGLGLAGSREVVRQMDGEIEVESVEGQGSTFTVVLPLSETAAPVP